MYFFLETQTGWPTNLKMKLFPKEDSPPEKESFPWGGHYPLFCCAHHSWLSQNNPDVAPLFLVSTRLEDVIFCIRKKELWHQSTKLNDKKTVQFSLVTQSCHTLCDPMDCNTPGLHIHNQLLESTQTHAHWVGDAIQLSHPLSPFSPLAFNLSQHQGLFQWVSFHIRLPKYWSFSFNISPSNEHPGLISLRMDLLDLLIVQGTLKSLLQHHSSKASVLWHLAFFTVQLSHPYMTTRKTITLTRWTFGGKVTYLLFNMLSRLAIAFLPRSKRLLILYLQSLCAVILEPRKMSLPLFTLFPHLFAMKWWDQMPWS